MENKKNEVVEVPADVVDYFNTYQAVEHEAKARGICLDRPEVRKVAVTILIGRQKGMDTGNGKKDPDRVVSQKQYAYIMDFRKNNEQDINGFLALNGIRFPTPEELDQGRSLHPEDKPILSVSKASELLDLLKQKN